MKLIDVDKNFKVATLAGREVCFRDAIKSPFVLEGFGFPNNSHGPMFRVPDYVTAESTEPGIVWLAQDTSGGVIRFCTDATFIALRGTLLKGESAPHQTMAGASGFDIYGRDDDGKFRFLMLGPVGQPELSKKAFEFGIWDQGKAGVMREYLLNLPTYNGFGTLEIGTNPEAKFGDVPPHKISKPICFYGSSITQGGCCTRPGNAYTAMLSREVDAEQINLGFSGNARGHIPMARAISELDLSCLVIDYDHNAPSAEFLLETHEKFFLYIRERHPELPVIFLTKPDFRRFPDINWPRRQAVLRTYANAVARGDKKVWYVDGKALFEGDSWDACTVDATHPNDLGFYRMYRAVLPVLREALGLPWYL
jgi:hypothetical protein